MRLSGFSGTTVSCLIVPLNKNKNNADDHRPAAKRKRTLLHACRPCPSGEGPERAGSWWPAADAQSVEEDRRRRRGDLQHGRGAVQTPRDHSRLQEVQGPSERTDLSARSSRHQYVTSSVSTPCVLPNRPTRTWTRPTASAPSDGPAAASASSSASTRPTWT